jgi:hypothetical protein
MRIRVVALLAAMLVTGCEDGSRKVAEALGNSAGAGSGIMRAAAPAAAAPEPLAAADVALPVYGANHDLRAALEPLMPLCLSGLAAEMTGGEFTAAIDKATAGWPADKLARAREICTAFRFGAIGLMLITEKTREAEAAAAGAKRI